MTKFIVHMIGLNRQELSARCLGSVFDAGGDFKLILTNNGSTDGTKSYFEDVKKRYPDRVMAIIDNAENEGFIGPNNKAFEMARKERVPYFVCLNNDTQVPARWLEMMAAPLDRDELGALSGPRSTCNRLHPNMDGYPDENAETEYIEGSCLCAKISIVEKQGSLFSDYLDFIYGDDSDLSLRMREAGYRIYQVPFEIQHARCATTHSPEVKERCKQAQEHNHKVGMKRWNAYLKWRHFRYPIVVKRKHAIGDVLLTTPVIEAIKQAYPDRPIWVETDFPQIFRNNPHVEKSEICLSDMDDVFPVIDLNNAYEENPAQSILEAYDKKALSLKVNNPKKFVLGLTQPKIYPSKGDYEWVENLFRTQNFSPKVCVMHADTTEWPGKQWPRDRYASIATWLVLQGWHVCAVGTKPLPLNFDAFDLINKTDVLQLAALISKATLFVGGDSLPLHIAMSVNCPAVGIFGVTQSKYIVHGNGSKIMLDAPESIPCAGLRHRVTGKERVDCSPACIESHTVEDVMGAIQKLGVL